MGFLDRFKKEVAPKPSENRPAIRPLPKKIYGVSEKTVNVLEKAQQQRNKKFLGLVIDATASRCPTWERAQGILERMFSHLSKEKGLVVRLIYFSGGQVGDMGWSDDLLAVQGRMAQLQCQIGHTQIIPGLEKFLADRQGHLPENVILIGDAFEEEIEPLKTALKTFLKENIRIFTFYEPFGRGASPSKAEVVFRKIAKVTKGVFQEYREGIYLDDLMMAVATFATEGHEGLKMLAAANSQAALIMQKELLQIEGNK